MRPDLISGGLPVGSVSLALLAQVLDTFRGLQIGAVGTGLVHHLFQQLGVFQHRAGTQMVLVEGLAVVVSHEQRAVQNFQNRLVVDIGVGVVDEHAGLGVTGRVDVEVVAAAGDAAAHELAVVLEVHGVERDIARRRAQIADTVDHILALFRGGHQLRGGFVAHGHIVEVEAEVCPLLAQEPHERIVGDGVDVLAGVADGGAEDNAVLLEQIHGVHHSGIVTFAAAGVVGLRGALDGQHKGDIAQTLHFFTEWLIDEGGVGVDGKLHIVVLFCQLEHVLLAHQRLAAGQHIQIHAQLLALRNDLVHILKAEVVLVAVLACPAAHAVHIAGRGGVEQNQPRDVALVFDAVLADHLSAAEEGFVAQIQRGGTRHMGVRDCRRRKVPAARVCRQIPAWPRSNR